MKLFSYNVKTGRCKQDKATADFPTGVYLGVNEQEET